MSHFSVAVISEKAEDIERLLAPYQENNMGDCPREFLAFCNTEDKERPRYESEGVKKIKTPDGRLLYPWDEEFRVPGETGIGSRTHKVPENAGYEKVEVKFKDLYPTFDDFMRNWHGCEGPDPETGHYGYWENPNKKWDYWRIGGRYRGILKARIGERGELSWEHAVNGRQHTDEEGFYDSTQIKELDLAEHQPATWALITPDGKWHERGEMGWFATSDATEESEKAFVDFFNKTLRETNPEHFITIVDCHI